MFLGETGKKTLLSQQYVLSVKTYVEIIKCWSICEEEKTKNWQNGHKNTKYMFYEHTIATETEKLKKTKPVWNQILQYFVC